MHILYDIENDVTSNGIDLYWSVWVFDLGKHANIYLYLHVCSYTVAASTYRIYDNS